MSVQAGDFRQALAAFPTGVTIITSVDCRNRPVGITASSFNSVSLDPPLILWSVTKTARSAPVFTEANYFGVHILSIEQTELAKRFSIRGADKFAGLPDDRDRWGSPRLACSAARFSCKTWAIYEGGDHLIIVGKVLASEREERASLVVGQGGYAKLSALESSL